MFVELHIIQNFAPSNLNRSDTGSPKDCEFGGYRRARISSQCIKRAMREYFKNSNVFAESQKAALAVRTKRLVDEITRRLVDAGKSNAEEACLVIATALNGVKLKVKENNKTQYLIYLGQAELDAIANLCKEHYDDLLTAAKAIQAAAEQSKAKSRGSAKESKKAGREAVPERIREALEKVLDGGRAADLALFGRMMADLPNKNVDAASQVAHALSTHKSGVEFDFYTAVDDIRPEDTEGADMLGTVEFNSACFYRYANVDLEQLRKNLGGDNQLASATLKAFVHAAVAAIPTGKQNSMAAQNPPSFVLVVVRRAGLWSLANAFLKPVRPTGDSDLVEGSIKKLDEYWGQITTTYGGDQIVDKCFVSLEGKDLKGLADARVNNIDELVKRMSEAIVSGNGTDSKPQMEA